MRAVRVHAINDPELVHLDEVDVPQPSADEALVRIRAAALNHRDLFITQGLYPRIALPITIGSDGTGECDGADVIIDPALDWGSNPNVWSPNATVLGMPRNGTFAEYVVVPRANIYPKPASLSTEEAAALPLGGLTAFRAVFARGELQRGETALITGVGGGVQTFALLFAKAEGARTIVTSGSDEKLERAKALGADVGINYRTDENWHKTARAAGPIDMVIDSAGGSTLSRCIEVVRPGGRVVIYGGTNGEATIRPFNIFWNHIDLRGTSMGSPDDFRKMLAFVEHHKIKPIVDTTFPLREAAVALRRMHDAGQFGKIVLTM